MNAPDAPDPRKVAEAALEAFVYVPLGLALEARDLVPKLAQRGRNQVVLARLGARFAMQRAEAEAERLVKRMQASAGLVPEPDAPTGPLAPARITDPGASTIVDGAGESTPSAPPAAPAGERGGAPARATPTTGGTPQARTRSRSTTTRAAKPDAPAPATPDRTARRRAGRSGDTATGTPRRASAQPPPARPATTALAIPGYDTLSASQVIPRLDALRPDELEAVRRHEASHRGRRTILSRVAQLQS
jgi:hypothetical protein